MRTETCCICNKNRPCNIRIFDRPICTDCEMRIVNTRVSDKCYNKLEKAVKKMIQLQHITQ